ncbi:LysR family transcriptional regulator [Ensifer sp. Root127]|uniref:LysR family transcriptional regulator n=2 Tax=unclassified Ensifer TaxID=2633371 RepID=UPI001FCD6747|nr:LysR family transcriptional regulator [Ensifer sp. Root127]
MLVKLSQQCRTPEMGGATCRAGSPIKHRFRWHQQPRLRRLEESMGVRLLARTTRNVVATEAGERLMETLRPAFNVTRSRIEELERNAPKTRRVDPRHIQPASRGNDPHARRQRLMADYPEVKIEISIDQRFVDLVAERYDAGVRLGESVEKDMIAV